jgi:hypothetical protein
MIEPRSRPVRSRSESVVAGHWIALINEHEKQFTLNIKLVVFLGKKLFQMEA